MVISIWENISHLINCSSETGAQDETGTGAVADTADAIS